MDMTCLLIGHTHSGSSTNQCAEGVEEIHEEQGQHHDVIVDIKVKETREIEMEGDGCQ